MRAFLAALLVSWLLPAAAADLGKPVILVAKPELRDQLFGASVLVVAPLGSDRHVGFIVNRPTNATLGTLFPEHAPSQRVVDPGPAGSHGLKSSRPARLYQGIGQHHRPIDPPHLRLMSLRSAQPNEIRP